MATPSYKERMKAARAAARAERLVREATHRRMVELRVTVRREAEAMVRKQIADRGQRVRHYLPNPSYSAGLEFELTGVAQSVELA